MPIVQCYHGPGQVSHTDWPMSASEQQNDRRARTRTKNAHGGGFLAVLRCPWIGSYPLWQVCEQNHCVTEHRWGLTDKSSDALTQTFNKKNKKKGGEMLHRINSDHEQNVWRCHLKRMKKKKKNVAFHKLLRPSTHFWCFYFVLLDLERTFKKLFP